MSLKVGADSAYRDMVKTDQRIPNISLTDQVSNVSLNEIQLSETSANSKQSEDNNSGEKKPLANPEKQMQSAISKANSELKFRGTKCEFKYYKDINRVAIKVLDKETDEVIREIPPEETIELIQKLWEFAGLLYDEKG